MSSARSVLGLILQPLPVLFLMFSTVRYPGDTRMSARNRAQCSSIFSLAGRSLQVSSLGISDWGQKSFSQVPMHPFPTSKLAGGGQVSNLAPRPPDLLQAT